MTTEVHETEQKYEAEPGVVLPSLIGLPQVATVSRPERETLTAEYYDTDDLRLLRAGITLRRREGGHDEGWHLKLPDPAGPTAGAPRRREIRLTLAQGDRDRADRRGKSKRGDPVPSELARLVRAHARDASLGPVARIETRRRRSVLRDADGTSLAEIAEDEVAAQSLGPATAVSRWNEIEVELTGGRPRLLRAADKRLRRSGLRPAGRVAKLERALAADDLAATGLPGVRVEAVGPDHRAPAGHVVAAYLREQAGRLKAYDAAVRRDEPDAVHQMRVTARRLRAALQAFPAVLPKPATARLRDDLRWLGRVLGDARDAEVLDQHFETALGQLPVELVIGPAKARVTAHFAPQQAAARKAALRALDSRRYFRLLDDLDGLIDDPPRTAAAAAPADEILSQAVARAYRRTRRRMSRARRTPAGAERDVALHEARKAAKRARYAADAAEPVFGRDARRFAKRMKAVQSVLGDHQDAVTARAVAREIGVRAHLAGENAFTFGLLNERAHRDAIECQRQLRPVWKRATRRKARRWLTRPAGPV